MPDGPSKIVQMVPWRDALILLDDSGRLWEAQGKRETAPLLGLALNRLEVVVRA